MDDEEVVRASVCSMLIELGYEALDAADGAEALSLIGENTAPISLALIDVVMPRMDGVETLRRIREQRRSLKVIVMSGFTTDERIGELAELQTTGTLAKPFTMSELAHAVSRALAEQDPRADAQQLVE